MTQEISLNRKIAVITGAGRGIGRATAIQLAQAGAAVAAVARTSAELEETCKQVGREGGSVLALPADVSNFAALERVAAKVLDHLGPVDIVIGCAGVLNPVGDTWQLEPKDWAQNININLTGAFYTARAFLPTMVQRQQGVLIFVSSGAATHPIPGWSAYSTAKAGLDHFVRNLAAEIEQQNLPLQTHSFYPGVVDTDMQATIRNFSAEQFPLVSEYEDYYQAGQLRPPEEPATVIRWVATPLAADLHGQPVSIEDAALRRRVADDLEIPLMASRNV